MSTVAGNSIQHTATQNEIAVMAPAQRVFYVNSSLVADVPTLPAPSLAPTLATPTSGVLTGSFYYQFTYEDANAGIDFTESNPSPANATAVSASADTVRVTQTGTAPSRATHYRVYRADASTGEPYTYRYVGRKVIGTTTFDDNTATADILGNDTLEVDHDPMPSMNGVYAHGALVFGWSDDFLYWSKATVSTSEGNVNPEYWPALNVNPIAAGDGQDIQGVCSVGDDLAIFKDASIHLLSYRDNPLTNGTFQPVAYGRGALNHRVIVHAHGAAFVMDEQGIYEYRGAREIIEIKGAEEYLARRNLSQKSTFWGMRYNNAIYWAVCLDGDTTPHDLIVLDLEAYKLTGVPSLWRDHYDHGLVPGAVVRLGGTTGDSDMAYENVPLMMDAAAQAYWGYHLTSDGVPNVLVDEYRVQSQTNPSSNTRLLCSKLDSNHPATDFDASGYDATGLYLRTSDTRYPGPYLITAVSALAVTISEEITDSLVSAVVWVGGIHQIYDTTHYDFDDPVSAKRFDYLDLRYRPLPPPFNKTVGVSVNRNRKGFEPVQIAASGRGLETTKGQTAADVTIGGEHNQGGRGFVRVSPGTKHAHSIQYRVEDKRPNRPLELLGMSQQVLSAEEVR